MRKAFTIGLALFFLTIQGPFASGQIFNFKNFTIEQGLSQSQNRAIFEDSRGYLWFGSIEGGISRYDGRDFKVYTEQDGLNSNIIYDIHEDELGNLWIGTNQGISIFDGSTFRSFEHERLKAISVYKILRDADNNMWLGTREKGLAIVKNKQLSFFEPYPELYLQTIRDLALSENGDFIIGTDNGLIIGPQVSILQNAPIFRTIKLPVTDSRTLSVHHQNDTSWIGTEKGLFFYIANELQKIDHPVLSTAEVRDIDADRFGHVWIGTYSHGLYIFDKGEYINFNESNGLINNRIQSIEEDQWGNVWLSTFFGVSKFMGRNFFHLNSKQGLKDELVWGLEEDNQGNIWIAHNKGISYFDGRRTVNIGVENGYKARRAWAIEKDKEGVLWVGTDEGLYKLVGNKATAMPSETFQSQFITLLYLAANNVLWVGGNEGVHFLDLNKKPHKLEKFKSLEEMGGRSINSMIADADGRLWLATEGGGLLVYDKDGRSKRLDTKNGLSSNVINEILEDEQGRIWLAHSLSGISRLTFSDRKGLKFSTWNIGLKEGLTSTNIYSLHKSGNQLWAGTERGIFKIMIQEDSIISIKQYDQEAGFTSIEANHKAVLKDSKGNFWWGTIKGVSCLDTRFDIEKKMLPKVYITDLNLFFEEVDWSNYTLQFSAWFHLPQNLVLPFDQNHLTFKYTGIELNQNSKLKFRFKLDGFDKDWSPASDKTEAVYANIPPGEYTFMVMASATNDWSSLPTIYKFKVKLPFYLTWWFFLLCFTVLGLLVYAYLQLRIGYLKRAKDALTLRVKERTQEIEKQKQEIEAQRDEIEAQRDQLEERSASLEIVLEEISKKNTQITSSINYAKRIQEAILPETDKIKRAFKDSFIIYMPRDIVSGDFYWFTSYQDKDFIAVVDCTGHGVPGAFMSMIGSSLLNQTINEKGITSPSEILDYVNKGVINALKQTEAEARNRDGMDMCLCVFHHNEHVVEFAGAKRSLLMVSEAHLEEIKGNRSPIGGTFGEEENVYQQHRIEYKPGTSFFLTSDGYADQFGGDHDRKFMWKRLKSLLAEIAHLAPQEQRKVLERTIYHWIGGREQTDDILMIGIKK